MKARIWPNSTAQCCPGKANTRALWDGCSRPSSESQVLGNLPRCTMESRWAARERHTDFHASALKSSCDVTCPHRTANGHCAGGSVNINGLKTAQVEINSCQHSTQGCRIAMAAAGAEKGDIVGQRIFDLWFIVSFRNQIIISRIDGCINVRLSGCRSREQALLPQCMWVVRLYCSEG